MPDAQVATQVEASRINARYEFFGKFVPAVYIAATAIPIWALTPVAEALAGRQTNFTVTISATLGLSVALGVGNGAQALKARGQSKELRRLRERVSNLEGQIKVLKERK